jgi:hypothetical protein
VLGRRTPEYRRLSSFERRLESAYQARKKKNYTSVLIAPLMAKPFAVERTMELSASVTLIGVVLAVIGLTDITTGTASLGGWSMWALVAGLVAFMFGIYWLSGYLRNVRDFRKLIEEQSKAAFIKDLDETEYLAWKLPIRFEEELQEKKKRLGVK